MKIHFYINFHTQPGESLQISSNADSIGGQLQYLDNDTWHCVFEVNTGENPFIYYKYMLHLTDGTEVTEGGHYRTLDISKKGIDTINVRDIWTNPAEYENVFYTAPFRQVLLKHNETNVKHKQAKTFTHIFKVKAPLLKKNEVICLSGAGNELKDWNTTNPHLLSMDGDWWSVKVDLSTENFPLEYKYGIYDLKKSAFVHFEKGENRILYAQSNLGELTVLHDGFIFMPNNTWKAAGVAIPVFSLKSKSSFGVGEFTDLKLLADWAYDIGLKVIQILPINDTTAHNTWQDSYPYSAISAFALHPIYINLEKVAGKKYAEIVKPFKKKQKSLNELADLNYEDVFSTKMTVLKELFIAQKEAFLIDTEFLQFFENNKHWLVPYAAFSYLRDKNGTADFTKWKIYKEYDKESIEKYVSPRARHYNDIATYYFIQYHLHLQLTEASEYAHKRGVILKGDIPIGIYRNSCDAWVEPALYNMDQQAGAPPDAFAVKGQNWGFPTYNWNRMEANGFSWWRQRFEQMSNYFDAFRIDHILGFFRIWSIPLHAVEGIMGYFEPAIPVQLKEFTESGIWFDHNRYTKPYITDQLLWETFGEDANDIREQFLDPSGFHLYELKEPYNTQGKVEAYFAGLEQNEKNLTLRGHLYDLISNVILFEVEGSNGEQFHFRISMMDTSSYHELEDRIKDSLKELYVDYFYRRQDDFWKKEALRKLPALKNATNMLVCGEDLGMVPNCVPGVMKGLGILSLEIQRMPKDPKAAFFHPHTAPYLSVVSPSTHDMSTIRGWWEEDRNVTQQFYNAELGEQGEAPLHCDPWISRSVILKHLYSPAMFSIFQLQDITGMNPALRREKVEEERINVPAIPDYYWRYRMHFTLEHLLKEKEFNQELKDFIKASGRS